jgi:hypothetical protein
VAGGGERERERRERVSEEERTLSTGGGGHGGGGGRERRGINVWRVIFVESEGRRTHARLFSFIPLNRADKVRYSPFLPPSPSSNGGGRRRPWGILRARGLTTSTSIRESLADHAGS